MIDNFVFNRRRRWSGMLAAAAVSATLTLPAASIAQERTDSEAVHQEDLSAQSAAKHHYASPADRAEDALLIGRRLSDDRRCRPRQGYADRRAGFASGCQSGGSPGDQYRRRHRRQQPSHLG
jgi:hypothetical protein